MTSGNLWSYNSDEMNDDANEINDDGKKINKKNH